MNSMTFIGSRTISGERSESGEFTTVVFSVRTADQIREDMDRAIRGGQKAYAEYSFISAGLLWAVLTAKRWDILTGMAGAGEVSIREVARRVQRDVKAVHGDVTALIKAGIIDRGESGKVVFPYKYFHLNLSNRQVAA